MDDANILRPSSDDNPLPPPRLYKYRSLDEKQLDYTRQIFDRSDLYFSSVARFNDPFEFGFYLSFTATEFEKRRWLTRYIENANPPLDRDEIRRVRKRLARLTERRRANFEGELKQYFREKVGVVSFSARCDDLLMWSHYADCHRGIVIEFDCSPGSMLHTVVLPVHYQAELPTLYFFSDSDVERLRKTSQTKAENWSYEEEWRIINQYTGPGPEPFPPDLLTGVILGARISSELELEVRRWAKAREHPVRISRAVISENSYSISIEEDD